MSDELAYQMAKQMYENIDTLYAAHNAAKVIKRENAIKGMPVPCTRVPSAITVKSG